VRSGQLSASVAKAIEHPQRQQSYLSGTPVDKAAPQAT